MNINNKTKARGLKRKFMKGLDPPPSEGKKSGLNPALPFFKPEKYPDADE